MPNYDGKLTGVEAQLNWYLWSQFVKDATALAPGEPADFVPVLVATPYNLTDAQIPDTVQVDLVDEIGCYKVWSIAGWEATAADPTNGPDPAVFGGWQVSTAGSNSPDWLFGALIQSWGGCALPTDNYIWRPPSNLYALSVRNTWTKYAHSDGYDLCITVFQGFDGISSGDLWATAFSAAGVDHAMMLLQTQTEIDISESQPRAMNYPVFALEVM